MNKAHPALNLTNNNNELQFIYFFDILKQNNF